MTVKEELQRKVDLSQTILKRLDSGENLSQILNQARFLMTLIGDNVFVALLDMFIHGLKHLPYQTRALTSEDYRKAELILEKLCPFNYSLDGTGNIIDVTEKGKEPLLVAFSVYEMENLPLPKEAEHGDNARISKIKSEHQLLIFRIKQILITLRAYIYDKVSSVLIESLKENDRISLFGQDYRIVTDNLNCLESPVGNELLAAVDDLQSTNPASWNSCGLICRNVIIKLAHLLWKVESKTYIDADGNSHDVSKDREKNILQAYIDYHLRTGPQELNIMLDEAKSLVDNIYNRGSEGKRKLTRKEAQELLVDTFNFVDLLEKSTKLVPLYSITK